MTRKDTILIAVVINAGLLAILFTTAVIYDTDKTIVPAELASSLADNKPPHPEHPEVIATAPLTGDEVDNVLKYYAAPSAQPIVVETQPETYTPEPIAIQTNAPDEEEASAKEAEPQTSYVEVTVKKGDVLEKIARANKSSVGAIKKANHLKSESLSIGQVLKVPVKQKASENPVLAEKKESKDEATPQLKTDQNSESAPTEVVYHIVKSGDNPWKIAKQYHVKYDDILRLNHLDEEKARNLKIGDRIRVK